MNSNKFDIVVKSAAIAIGAVVGISVVRTLFLFRKPKKETLQETAYERELRQLCRNSIESKRESIIDRFCEAIRFKTITFGNHDYDRDQLRLFGEFIGNSFPRIHSSENVKCELVNEYSLLYTVTGSDTSLAPYLLMAHLDVVPVEENQWKVEPFGGIIDDNFIYGRGSVDVKSLVMSLLEAFEILLENGYKPKRSFYIAFGHDEEASGFDGAANIAKLLKSRGIGKLKFILDEGLVIITQGLPGIDEPVAMIGVTEKGYATFKVTAHGESGHSAIPPNNSATSLIADAVTKLHTNVFENKFGSGIEKNLLESLAPYASIPFKYVYSNLWLFGPVVSRIFTLKPATNTIVRTSTAITNLASGVKENVIPSSASLIVNHRIHPSQTVLDVYGFDSALLKSISTNFKMEMIEQQFEPHDISPFGDDEDSFGYQVIKSSINNVFSGVVVAPGVVIGGTDTKWYREFTNSIYRFIPVVMKMSETNMVHGHNERIAIDNYLDIVNYYIYIITLSDAGSN